MKNKNTLKEKTTRYGRKLFNITKWVSTLILTAFLAKSIVMDWPRMINKITNKNKYENAKDAWNFEKYKEFKLKSLNPSFERDVMADYSTELENLEKSIWISNQNSLFHFIEKQNSCVVVGNENFKLDISSKNIWFISWILKTAAKMKKQGNFNSDFPDWQGVIKRYNQTLKDFIALQNSHFDASWFFFEPGMWKFNWIVYAAWNMAYGFKKNISKITNKWNFINKSSFTLDNECWWDEIKKIIKVCQNNPDKKFLFVFAWHASQGWISFPDWSEDIEELMKQKNLSIVIHGCYVWNLIPEDIEEINANITLMAWDHATTTFSWINYRLGTLDDKDADFDANEDVSFSEASLYTIINDPYSMHPTFFHNLKTGETRPIS